MITITTNGGHVLRFISAPEGLPKLTDQHAEETLIGLVECGRCGSIAALTCSHPPEVGTEEDRTEHLLHHLHQASRSFDADVCQTSEVDVDVTFPAEAATLVC